MSEGWLAFGLAMMCERFLWPEDAFKSLAAGKVCHEKRSLDTIGPEIIALKACGFKYQEIDEMYHLAKRSAMCLVYRWKKQRRLAG